MSIVFERPLPRDPDDPKRSDDRPGLLLRWWDSRLGRRFLREIVIIAVLFLVYKQVRWFARDQVSAAFDNARWVIDVEQTIGIFSEVSLQKALLPFTWLIGALNNYYIVMHFLGTTAVMVGLYLFRSAHYFRLRRVLFLVSGLAMLIHIGMPLAPPRMIPHVGFLDTLEVYGPDLYPNDASSGTANQFAAMPSLHFGYSLMVSLAVIGAVRTRWRWLILIHPFLTLSAIVVTANHYWLDAGMAAVLVFGVTVFYRAREIRRGIPVSPAAAGSFF